MLRDWNNTFLSLIPKKATVETMEDFRPISICNTTYKIISKVMENRMKEILSLIISEEQSGFTPGKAIIDGIVIAHEAIHSIKKIKAKKMIIKLDIKKAYDQVDK